jgi:DNA-binding transcriptional LysR family regulator
MEDLAMERTERIERRLKLHDLRVLMSVVEQGSMAKAAERLATSQPALSRAIADLEHSLGVRLLDRGPRGVVPTPYGCALVKRGFAVFDELRQSVKDIEFLADPTAGEVRIAAATFMATGLLATAVDGFARRYPGISFHLITGRAEEVHRVLEQRDVDAAISTINPFWERQAHMQREVLYADARSVFAARQNRWSRRRKVTLADLISEPWTLPPADSAMGDAYANIFRAAGLDPPSTTVVSLNQIDARIALVAKGQFLTIVSEADVKFADSGGAIKALPINLSSHREVGIITLKNRTLTPAVQLFLDYVRQLAKPLTMPKTTLPRRRQIQEAQA